DILGHRHRIKEREVLENHADTELTRVARLSHNDGTPLPEDMSRVGLQQPIEHLDQGRLSGAVLTEQGMHLTHTHSKIDPIICDQGPEPLDQAVRLEQQRLPTGWRHWPGRTVPFTPHRSASRLLVDERPCRETDSPP